MTPGRPCGSSADAAPQTTKASATFASKPSNLCCSDRGGIFADGAFLATSGDR